MKTGQKNNAGAVRPSFGTEYLSENEERDRDNKEDNEGDDKEDNEGDDKGEEGSRTLIQLV